MRPKVHIYVAKASLPVRNSQKEVLIRNILDSVDLTIVSVAGFAKYQKEVLIRNILDSVDLTIVSVAGFAATHSARNVRPKE